MNTGSVHTQLYYPTIILFRVYDDNSTYDVEPYVEIETIHELDCRTNPTDKDLHTHGPGQNGKTAPVEVLKKANMDHASSTKGGGVG